MKDKLFEKLLLEVQKPARYIGGETGSIVKDFEKSKCKIAFCFPDTYEIGMSHLGMKILYGVLNENPDYLCERFFAPWIDMEQKMRENNIPLYSLENKKALNEFDIIGFTLQYEMSYTNILNMLDLGNVEKLSSKREGNTFVCFGGPCAYNCEPIADFADFVMLGEGEELFLEVADAYVKWKDSGKPRKTFLETIARIEGIYVPGFYDVEYNSDGTVKEIKTNNLNAAKRPKKRIIKNMDDVYYPTNPIVPFTEIVHNRAMLEIFRGCTRGCRFCQAGFIYRPVREKSPNKLFEQAAELVKNTGYDELSLTSLSSSDYSCFNELADKLLDITESKKVNLALPSLRVDNFSVDLMNRIQKVRKSGLTFAPEAGTQRLRDVINKNVTEQDLLNTSALAFSNGWSNIKLYFMMGLPFETKEDILGIADLAQKVVDVYFNVSPDKKRRQVKVTVSTSVFVPKPFTPFQWEGQEKIESVVDKQNTLKQAVSKHVTYNWHDSKLSYLEAVFARGDRRLSKVMLKAFENGCKFDSWDECFNFEKWLKIFEECEINPDFYAVRKRDLNEILPWSHIDVGISLEYLKKELQNAKEGKTTNDCRQGCTGCGINGLGGVKCV